MLVAQNSLGPVCPVPSSNSLKKYNHNLPKTIFFFLRELLYILSSSRTSSSHPFRFCFSDRRFYFDFWGWGFRFLGRKRKKQIRMMHPDKDKFTSLVSNDDFPWIASQNFEPFRKKITMETKTVLIIKARIPENTPRRFSFSILPKENDDASQVLFHVSLRPTSEKKQMVFNSKHNVFTGTERTSGEEQRSDERRKTA